MKKLCLYGLLWLFPIVLCATTYAQTKPMPKTGTVKGRVTGSGDDRPIAGITVRLAGDTLAGTSNGNGLFLIRRVRWDTTHCMSPPKDSTRSPPNRSWSRHRTPPW